MPLRQWRWSISRFVVLFVFSRGLISLGTRTKVAYTKGEVRSTARGCCYASLMALSKRVCDLVRPKIRRSLTAAGAALDDDEDAEGAGAAAGVDVATARAAVAAPRGLTLAEGVHLLRGLGGGHEREERGVQCLGDGNVQTIDKQ